MIGFKSIIDNYFSSLRKINNIGLKKISRFFLVGLINAISGYSLIILLYILLDLNIYLSNFIGYFFGLIISFTLNRNFVFKAKGKILNQFLRFVFCFFLSYFLNIFVFYISSELINMNRYLAILLASIFYSISFFISCNFFIFKKKFSKNF